MQSAYDLFYELFLSTEIFGYFGPLAIVIIGYLIAKKEKTLAVLWVVVQTLIIAQYFALLEATPDYWWQIIILLMGVIISAFQLVDR